MKQRISRRSRDKDHHQATSRRATRAARRGTTPPVYEVEKSGKVGNLVQILGVELLHAHFSRQDDGPLAGAVPVVEAVPRVGVNPDWKLSDDRPTLGCAITFGTIFDEPEPYSLVATFRLTYSIPQGVTLTSDEIDNFVHWNSVFNVWPYWREYLSSTINRASLPRFIAPIIRL